MGTPVLTNEIKSYFDYGPVVYKIIHIIHFIQWLL